MKVLCDIHHEELFESLRLLFETRLGWEVYRPVGEDWWREGYWKIGSHLSLEKQWSAAVQHLGMHNHLLFREYTPDDILLVGNCFIIQEFCGKSWLRNLNLAPVEVNHGIFHISSPAYPWITYKGITLEEFKDTHFDILVSTVPDQIDPFNELIRLYQSHAKHIFQAGNPWTPPVEKVQNILTSTTATKSEEVNCVYYHQEFDLALWHPVSFPKKIHVMSMMHYLSNFDIFFDLEAASPGWEFRLYGAGCRDGVRGPRTEDVVQAYRDSYLLWHVKREGEGYGYNIHHAAAMGVPVIVRKHHFKGQTVEPLLVDGETCIDLDGKDQTQVQRILQDVVNNYDKWSTSTYNRFKEVVDFDEEFESIKQFLGNLR